VRPIDRQQLRSFLEKRAVGLYYLTWTHYYARIVDIAGEFRGLFMHESIDYDRISELRGQEIRGCKR
jgi:hypothetical protein